MKILSILAFRTAVKERHAGVRRERKTAFKSLTKYQKLDFTLNCDQHENFLGMVAALTEQCPEELSKVLCEADAWGKGDVIRKLWKHDVEDHLAFKKDQTRNGKSTLYFITNYMY